MGSVASVVNTLVDPGQSLGHQQLALHSRKSNGPFSEPPQFTPLPTSSCRFREKSSVVLKGLSSWRETLMRKVKRNELQQLVWKPQLILLLSITQYPLWIPSPSVIILAGGGVISTFIPEGSELLVTITFLAHGCCVYSYIYSRARGYQEMPKGATWIL